METGHGQKLTKPEFLRLIARRGFHRAVFTAAGIYNIAWGLYAAYDPQWLFRFAGMPPLDHPQIFRRLGMVW